MQSQLELSEATVLELQEASAKGGNVADVSSVFSLLKSFRSGFDKVDVSLQAEVLRDVIANIEVQKEGVRVKVFGLSGGNLSKNLGKTRPAVCRSGVRTVYDLVETSVSTLS